MRMTSLSVMWAASSYRILRSANAGGSWQDVTPAGPPGKWTGFFALSDSAAWAVHVGDRATTFTMFRTTDGGRTWLLSTGPAQEGLAGDITFVDRLHGWLAIGLGAAAGSEAIAIDATSDGGATWRLIAESDPPSGGLGSSGIAFGCDKGEVAFGSPTVGILPTSCATDQQYAYRTTDGGRRWTSVELPAMAGVFQAFFLAPIFLDGADAVMAGGHELAVTHDGGASWTAHSLPGTGTIDFESPLSGWQLDEQHLYATPDGGRTWHVTGSSLPFRGTDLTLQFLGRGIGLAWGFAQTSAYRTDDGGKTWRSVAPSGLSS